MDYQMISLHINKKTSEWSIADVCKWLQLINLTSQIVKFQNACIDGNSLRMLTSQDLINGIGIKSKIVCKKLINWIINGLQQFDQYLQSIVQQILPQIQPMIKTQNNYQKSIFRQSSINSKKSLKKKTLEDLLILKKVELAQKFYYKICQRDCRIGSNPNCEIQIFVQNIQPFHAYITYCKGSYYLKDSTGLGPVYIKVDNRVLLFDGMVVEMGSNLFQISIDENKKIQIKIKQGKNKDTVYKFTNTKTKILIGRRANNDISFPQDITLSNLHSRMTLYDQNWYLQDLATTNGTWYLINKEHKIFSGIIFKLGLTNTQFQCELRKIRPKQSNQDQLEQKSFVYVQLQNQICRKCCKNMRNILYQPCNHCVVCEQCNFKDKICQICGNKIIAATKIFKS